MNDDPQSNRNNVLAGHTGTLTSIFGLTLFTSAALLFWVQPLVAKMLLPVLGGTPSVWNTCMVFFQALLLAGYGYSLLISQRLSLKNQLILHVFLLVSAALVLPLCLPERLLLSLPAQKSPIVWLLTTLLVTVGPPFLLLSATAPLLQKWFSHTSHKAASDPYFLYAISNAGSILALLAFPFVLEPAFAVRTQSILWTTGYACLALLIIACAILLRRKPTPQHPVEAVKDSLEELSRGSRLEWLLLAFIPSSLMLGVTTFIATDIASVPLIWTIPLTLYLLTFIVAFAPRQVLNPSIASISFPVVILGLGAVKVLNPPISIWATVGLHLLTFFLAALVCHQRLARRRPDVSKLPEYYFWIALGGVLGGAFNALLAPLIFSTPVEYPIAMVLACLMRQQGGYVKPERSWFQIAFPALIFLLTLSLSLLVPRFGFSLRIEHALVLLGPLALCFVIGLTRPIIFGLGLAALMFAAVQYLDSGTQMLTLQRNFFGIWQVTSNPNERARRLHHGTTVHGLQLRDQSQRCEATTYYSKAGPLGQVFDVYNAAPAIKPIAAIGLGAGTIATYSTNGQQWDFYEIDPAIVQIASNPNLFTFLSDCMRSPYRTIIGDARLKLHNAAHEYYGLIVMDAFSSDSVPAHLLTTEALDLYLSKLATDGVLAFHITNRYLNMEPLLAGLSQRAGLSAFIRSDGGENLSDRFPSTWVVMARDQAWLGTIPTDPRWAKLKGHVVWTDDFSNIISLFE